MYTEPFFRGRNDTGSMQGLISGLIENCSEAGIISGNVSLFLQMYQNYLGVVYSARKDGFAKESDVTRHTAGNRMVT